MNKIIVNLDLFPDHQKHLVEIFGDLLELEMETNPLATGLAIDAENTIDTVLAKFDEAAMRICAPEILKSMWSRHEIAPSFYRVEVLQSLVKLMTHSIFDISSGAISFFNELLFPENKGVQEQVIFLKILYSKAAIFGYIIYYCIHFRFQKYWEIIVKFENLTRVHL